MKQSTKKAIAVMVAATFPICIVVCALALPVIFVALIIGGIYSTVLELLNHDSSKNSSQNYNGQNGNGYQPLKRSIHDKLPKC